MAERDPRLDSMGTLAATMYQDPEMKDVMDKWVEEKFPGTQGRLQTAKTVAEARAAITKEREDFKKEIETERAARAREREIERIKNDPVLRIKDDEVKAVEELAIKRGIGNWEDAAHAYRRVQPVAAPQQDTVVHGLDLNDINHDSTKWLAPAFGKDGIVNLSVLDRVTRNMKDTILADYAKDPLAADRRWS